MGGILLDEIISHIVKEIIIVDEVYGAIDR